jgi:hypothetical protein
MIEFTIKDKAYKIEKVTIGDSYKVDQYLHTDDEDNKFEIISVLSGCPLHEVKSLKLKEWNYLWHSVVNMFQSIEPDFARKITLGGIEYGMMDVSKMTIGEFSDIDVISQKQKSIHEVLAVLYRPIVNSKNSEYEIEAYDSNACQERSIHFLDCELRFARGCTSFFLKYSQEYLKSTQVYLDKILELEIKKLAKYEKQKDELMLLQQDHGTTFTVSSLVKTLQSLKQSQDFLSSQPSTSWLERFKMQGKRILTEAKNKSDK